MAFIFGNIKIKDEIENTVNVKTYANDDVREYLTHRELKKPMNEEKLKELILSIF